MTDEERQVLDLLVPLAKERLKVLSDIVEVSSFLFREIEFYNIEEILSTIKEKISFIFREKEENVENLFRELSEKLGVKLGDFIMPLRIAVTGSRVSPPIIGTLKILGAEKTLQRIDRVIDILKNEVENG